MNTWTGIAILVILVIIIIYYISFYKANGELPSAPFSGLRNAASKTYDEYFTDPQSLYTKIVGHIKNDTVEMAINKAKKKERMNRRNEETADISDKNINDAATNAFILGDLIRFNVVPNEPANRENLETEVADVYQRVLERVVRNPDAVIAGQQPEMPAPEFMLDRIEDFYDGYAVQMMYDMDGARDNLRNARLRIAAMPLQQMQTQPQPRPPRRRIKKQRKNATIKQQQQDIYFEERDVGNDPQNVHESEVTNQMHHIYNRLVFENSKNDLNIDPAPTISQIKSEVVKHVYENDVKRRRALKALDIISSGNWIGHLNEREDKVLLNVWKRINAPHNRDNRDNLKTAFMDSLADCIVPDYYGVEQPVCTMGRAERVINSLTLLDANSDISAPVKTREIMRNEVFSKSHQIIQNALKDAPVDVARAYNGVTTEQGPELKEKVAQFEQELKEKIADDIRETYPTAKQETIAQLILDAQAGV